MRKVVCCPVCLKPYRLIQKPDGSTVFVCDCKDKEIDYADLIRSLDDPDTVTLANEQDLEDS
jgi:hypothetical protein